MSGVASKQNPYGDLSYNEQMEVMRDLRELSAGYRSSLDTLLRDRVHAVDPKLSTIDQQIAALNALLAENMKKQELICSLPVNFGKTREYQMGVNSPRPSHDPRTFAPLRRMSSADGLKVSNEKKKI